MDEPTIRRRIDDDLPGCVAALATVQAADRYPVDWPADPAGWLTPAGLVEAWVAVDGDEVLGHLALTRPGAELAATLGLPERQLLAVARLFVGTAARRRGVAVRLLDQAVLIAGAEGLTPVLEVEEGAEAAVRLYERARWRHAGTSTADWTTADGRTARLRAYVAPVEAGLSSRPS
ncbi:GNAT family N-acetyltransferase [Kitasatospora sp. NPDC127111]|uniref:GNAT family N-acetyltransferase n=1 Tax=Kitasatospora sp. NPDC127111 TaxID=3345363 RepID=UPI00362669E0